jgi:hypothetical protein
MSAPIPTVEPTVLVAGDTWQWDREAADFPPSEGWSLTYVFNDQGEQRFTITSAAAGTVHRVTRATTDTDDVIPGTYEWVCFAKKTGERRQIASGRVQIKPNFEGIRPFDTRTDARVILDGLMALKKQHAGGQAMVQEYTIAGRSMKFRTGDDLLKEINYWRVEVAREERAAKIKAGLQSGRHIGVRFGRV